MQIFIFLVCLKYLYDQSIQVTSPSISLALIFDLSKQIKGWDFSPTPSLPLSPLFPTNKEERKEQTTCHPFGQMERCASQWRGALTKSEKKFSGHKGWRRRCTRRRTSPDDGRCTHWYSKCGMEPSCFTKSCFLNVLTIIKKQSLGCLKHSLQRKTGQCLQRICPCFQVLSPRCNFIIYKNCHFPPARGKNQFYLHLQFSFYSI